jgi:hypothetical protein
MKESSFYEMIPLELYDKTYIILPNDIYKITKLKNDTDKISFDISLSK